MCRLRLERGQTTAEYVGVLVVVVAVIAAISAADIGAQVTRKVEEAIAAIATDGGLDDSRGGDPETNSQPSVLDGTRRGLPPASLRGAPCRRAELRGADHCAGGREESTSGRVDRRQPSRRPAGLDLPGASRCL